MPPRGADPVSGNPRGLCTACRYAPPLPRRDKPLTGEDHAGDSVEGRMTSTRPGPGLWRERGFLAFGLGSALLLVLAALAGGGSPESTGRAELVSTAARIAEAVTAEWRGGRVLLRVVEESGAPPIEWDGSRLPFSEGNELRYGPESGQTVFDALFAKSEQVELAQQDPQGALELVLEALPKTDDAARRADARLRAVQLAVKAARSDVAREQHRLACVELDGSELRGEVSYRLLLAVAVAPAIPEPERESFAKALRSDIGQGKIAWRMPEPESVLREDPSVAALRDLLEQAWPGCLPTDFALVRTAVALAAVLGELPMESNDDACVRLAGERFFVWRHEFSGHWTGHFLDRRWAREALQRATVDAGVVPAGFLVDIDPPGSRSAPVRDHDTLDGDFGFTVKHEDPEGWIRRSATKQRYFRGALLVMALLSAAAGAATFRALRRERALAGLKTDFVANVSHELRTPLASILLLAENLEAGRVGTEAEKSRYHTLIRREALRLRRLVDDVLDFSRLERGRRIDVRREPTRVDPWLERLAEDLAEWAREHGLELALERSPTGAEADLDPEALRRALLNLLDNARKHSGTETLELRLAREGGGLVLAVRDHGQGIPAALRERVFEPFTRLDEKRSSGAGLGLSIVREIAREHGGTVRALDPESGPGIVFEMRIPLDEFPA